MESKILQMAELFVFAELIEKNSANNQWLWGGNDAISKSILEKEGGWINICPGWWSSLSFIGNCLNRVCRRNFEKLEIVKHLKY